MKIEKQIKLRGREIQYTLKTSKRAKRMRLAIYCTGALVATKPWMVSDNAVERFIVEKANWVLSKLEFYKLFNAEGGKIERKIRGSYLRDRNRALEFVEDRIVELNKFYKFEFNRINIKNQKTRWGSCSKKGNLNFNYKLLFLPQRVADYIIIHELCHLKEFNHSQKFWNLVSLSFPDYKEIRTELKKNSINL